MGETRPPTEPWQHSLLAGAADLTLPIADAHLAAYRTHLDLLLAHNARAGLTTITDPAEIAVKHFLDSLAGLLVRDVGAGERIADVGSGAGFPGVVLAVARPDASYTLVESNRRRAAFLSLLCAELGLAQATVVTARAEEVGRQPGHRGTYDLVMSRAVAPLPVLLEYCLPLARVGGEMLAYKGPEAAEELDRSAAALAKLGGRLVRTHRLVLPQNLGGRVLVLITKVAPTPATYPRRPGVPARRPLGP